MKFFLGTTNAVTVIPSSMLKAKFSIPGNLATMRVGGRERERERERERKRVRVSERERVRERKRENE